MPEGINSGGWVLVGWGAACGAAIAALVCMSYHWWYRLRTHVTVAGAAEQQIEGKRDRAALRERRRLYAQKCANPNVSPFDALAAHGKPVPARTYPRPPVLVVAPDPRRVRPVIERVTYINTAVTVEPWAVNTKPHAVIPDEPEPVPDAERRRVEDDGDGYPPCLQAEAASALRRQTRDVAGDKRDNAAPGRHRLPRSRSDDTRQFTFRETLDAAVGEPS